MHASSAFIAIAFWVLAAANKDRPRIGARFRSDGKPRYPLGTRGTLL